MSLFHAVVWTDHQSAQVLQFDAEHVKANKVKAHSHHTAQHGSQVRTEHEFFGELCDSLDGITEVLATGSRTALADLRHYAEKLAQREPPIDPGQPDADLSVNAARTQPDPARACDAVCRHVDQAVVGVAAFSCWLKSPYCRSQSRALARFLSAECAR